MIALLVTVLLFVVAGAAVSGVLRFNVPGTISGRIAFWYLAGIAVVGTVLYVLGAIGVPIVRVTIATIFVASVVVAAIYRVPLQSVRHPLAANMFLAVPLLALFLSASILPVRDYDGRATWLPKARAIAHDGAIDGPFFQGNAGLNLHNQYPLLMPLNAAAVLLATGDDDVETVRWLYVLIAIAAFLAARDLDAWVIAAAAWLPVLWTLEGGALAAYNDVAMMALGGMAVLCLYRNRDARAAALFLIAIVLLKNEGVVMAVVILASAIRRAGFSPPPPGRGGLKPALRMVVPVIGAVLLLFVWRRQVPPAYDEQYNVLIRELPNALHRLPQALHAFASHAFDFKTWGFFWPLTIVAIAIALIGRRRATIIGPLLVLVAMLGVYALTFTVTSWNIDELARVAASRLLLHLVIPACFIIAVAAETAMMKE